MKGIGDTDTQGTITLLWKMLYYFNSICHDAPRATSRSLTVLIVSSGTCVRMSKGLLQVNV